MRALFVIFFAVFSGCSSDREIISKQMNQFPSPMVDHVRTHERIEQRQLPGLSLILENGLSKPIDVYVADLEHKNHQMDLLIHFHGSSYVPKYAVYKSKQPLIVATVNLGSGSSVYENAFLHEDAFPNLVEAIIDSVSEKKSVTIEMSKFYISSFSAGYGAVRAILKKHQAMLDGIILLDGLHTDYIPPGRVLSQGGKLNVDKLLDFVQYARLAIENKKKFLITHSEIFPGTYASTTETADYLISTLGLEKTSVLKWGPVGMQQLSETSLNGLTILGFAGNSAPDHVDHFHGLPVFLNMILDH